MRSSLRYSCVTTETPPDVTQDATDQEALALLHDVVTRLAAIETSAARACGHTGTLPKAPIENKAQMCACDELPEWAASAEQRLSNPRSSL